MSKVLLGTTSHAVTGVAYTFQPDAAVSVDPNVVALGPTKQAWIMRVWGDVNFHIAVNDSAVDAVPANDMPVADHWNGLCVVVPPGGYVSVIKKVGETDGTVWFTRIKHH
jgi:hypothetical protein